MAGDSRGGGLVAVPRHWSLAGLDGLLNTAKMPDSGAFSPRGWSHRWLDLRWTDTGLAPAGGRLLSWTPAEKGGVLDVVEDWREAPGAAAGGTTTVQLTVDAGPLHPVLGWTRTVEARDDMGRTRSLQSDEGALRGRSLARTGTAGGPLALDSKQLLTDLSLPFHLWALARAGDAGVHVADGLRGLEGHLPGARLAPCGKQLVPIGGTETELRGWRWTAPGLLPLHGWVAEARPLLLPAADRVWLLQDLLPPDHPLRAEAR